MHLGRVSIIKNLEMTKQPFTNAMRSFLPAVPLADYVFKPGISAGSALVPLFEPLVGVGANHGVGLLISTLGFLLLVVSIIAFCIPAIRNVEIDLPDHVAG
jgi:hypothetical protein